ncbi:hypothetical protein BWI97_01740 [Siphonobacter sp. BAB-5405]|uniref:hypothetical protein n=1 Tax=Siphonobacter sp. BAB-5405 TaxID=1864825 RepID=UPI000C800F35|nr:hypothetical protein [Siphonobacter sp. BAB-5405]PMD99154.1 hypothetical protein BWI97_01740 [Siphonobacter sp. BAB-5405]
MTHLEALVAQYLGIQELMFTFLEERPEVALPLADALAKKQTTIIGEMGTSENLVLRIVYDEYELVTSMEDSGKTEMRIYIYI